MCNDYRNTVSIDQVAALLGVEAAPALNYAAEVFPGHTGLVAADGRLRAMTWGFPRRLPSMKPTSKPKAVCNARDDKLRSFFWHDSFVRRRCLIPATRWAEPLGERGRMTKTWYRPAGEELFVIAGLWRPTDEWGNAYTMVMVDSSAQMAEVHDRMPVILRPEHWRQWTDGSLDDAEALLRTWSGRLDVDHSSAKWGSTDTIEPTEPLLL